MKNSEWHIDITRRGHRLEVLCTGRWHLHNLGEIERRLSALDQLERGGRIIFDLSDIVEVDTAAMLFFIGLRSRLKQSGIAVKTHGVPKQFAKMFRLIRKTQEKSDRPIPGKEKNPLIVSIEALGRLTYAFWYETLSFIAFMGETFSAFRLYLRYPSSVRTKEISANLYATGTTALPIIALSAFLIGVVIAYQSATVLQQYGANIYIVDMVGISIVRELAPLIAAIIVAGRSGSSFTAQIGVMKITEEIDAMKTMGFEIFRFIVLPRIIALMIALPLLVFFADIMGIAGGVLIAKTQLGIMPPEFIARLAEKVALKHYVVGVVKAPVFAFIIASIGCLRGFEVTRNTESIGTSTTISVVNAIFMVIAVDAVFSVILTKAGI